MKVFVRSAIALAVLLALAAAAGAQTWTALTNSAPAPIGPVLQLRDGRILAHEDQGGNANNWWILTPDANGSYVNGTWSSGGSMQPGYAPFFFSSAVMLDGKHVIVEGGEYNNGTAVWTTLGAYGTLTGNTITWAANAPPAGWGTIGDAQSVILPNGVYMQANCCNRLSALFNGPNSWNPNGQIAGVDNDEQAYTLLTNDKVMSVEAWNTSCFANRGSELYTFGTKSWACSSATPTQMWDSSGHELGPDVMMYNGKTVQFGAVPSTAIYDVASNTWVAGPTPANGLDAADAPAALEPNGKVLAMLSPGEFAGGCQMVEYDPNSNSLASTANPANCPADSSFVGHLMILPTGQIMFTDFNNQVEVYTPAPGVVAGVAPLIFLSSNALHTPSNNNVLNGTQLNGLSQNNAYGDDYQADTNFPLVRLKEQATGKVFYARTHDDSTHSIAPGTAGITHFDVPAGLKPGLYDLSVVANGIESNIATVRMISPNN
jgi:hypothetical protein